MVRHDQHEALFRILCKGTCQIDDVFGVLVRLESEPLRCVAPDNLARSPEDALLAPLAHFVGAGMLRVCVGNHVVGIQVVLEVGVRYRRRIDCIDILRLFEGRLPGCIDELEPRRSIGIPVARHALLDMRHQVMAGMVFDLPPPSEVVQAIIAIAEIAVVLEPAHRCHDVHQGNRHVADVDDPRIGTKPPCRFRDDCGRVRIVEHPGIGRILFHVIHEPDHAADRAQTIGNAARSTGLLAEDPIFQRYLLVLVTHRVLADANLCQHEIDARKRLCRIGRVGEFDFGVALPDIDGAGVSYRLLPFGIIVVEDDLSDRKLLCIVQQHQHDSWRIGRAASRNRHCIALLSHRGPFLSR